MPPFCMVHRFKAAVIWLTAWLAVLCSPDFAAGKAPARMTDSLSVSVIGDIIIHDTQLGAAYQASTGTWQFDPVFREVRTLLSAADITVGNLETTLPGDPSMYSGYPQFGAPDALAAALANAGVDILCTANNHACDKGRIGLVRTLDVLDSLNMLHLGTYRSAAEYEKHRILLIQRNHISIAMLNYTYAVNGLPVPDGTRVNFLRRPVMAADMALARKADPDFIIVMVHFGGEYLRQPDDFQRRTVQFLFHEGADIVLGSHPHVLQPYEIIRMADKYGEIRPRLVIYSLGNFISNQRERYRNGGIIFNFTLIRAETDDARKITGIADISHEPVWVYAGRTRKNRKDFVILPVRDYIRNDQSIRLDSADYRTMMTFFWDTNSHLKSSEELVRKASGEHGNHFIHISE